MGMGSILRRAPRFAGRALAIRAWSAGLALAVSAFSSAAVFADGVQSELTPRVNVESRVLEFDWPTLSIGTGEYAEGPTGVTVIRFNRRSLAAIDVRGGAPGTINSDYLRYGYDLPELDAVVFAGGSWYGLETVTAVSSALKDDGVRDGNAFGASPNIALSVGSIIFDFGPRRLNEIYPDQRLAQAAFRAARTGRFPLGAQGAGRFAKTGGLFGCNAFSGQGAAFRQIGDLKIAVFTVVNALGVVVDREGGLAACYRGVNWPSDVSASDLMRRYPQSRDPSWAGPTPERNTTVSLVVVNQSLTPVELQRLAVQVHTSMGRAIQPFATEYDGDVLYAVSTQEWEPEAERMSSLDIGVIASELMWDAVLSSVPDQMTAAEPVAEPVLSRNQAREFAGEYEFSAGVRLQVTARGARVFAQATGVRAVYAIGRDAPVELSPVSDSEFVVPGRYPMTLRFSSPDRLVINPGHWEQIGMRH